jgi:CRISPR/Cas system type I-B associated protein Csh2 (Cas7 group RAMP superfamily)
MTTATMRNKVSDLETARQKVAQMRDELKLKMHLASMDARDEWNELEGKWSHFEAKAKSVQDEGEEVAEQVWTDVKQLSKTLREGYEKLRKTL